jgi:hypothetical protein
MDPRGLTYAQAIAYLGVKRRVFDSDIRPLLNSVRIGSSRIFDRIELDRIFDELMRNGSKPEAQTITQPAESRSNGTPVSADVEPEATATQDKKWDSARAGFTKTRTARGKSTNGGRTSDFDSVVSSILKRRNAGLSNN